MPSTDPTSPIDVGVTIISDSEPPSDDWDWLWRRLLAPLPDEAKDEADPTDCEPVAEAQTA